MWDWYKLFNFDEFMALELSSRSYAVVLQNVGNETILISRGNLLSISFRGVYLPIDLLGINPNAKEGYASFLDDNRDVWLGIEQ